MSQFTLHCQLLSADIDQSPDSILSPFNVTSANCSGFSRREASSQSWDYLWRNDRQVDNGPLMGLRNVTFLSSSQSQEVYPHKLTSVLISW